MKYCSLLLMILLPGGLWGQDYLVTSRFDTVRGKISIESFEKFDKVAVTINKKKSEYAAYAVLHVYLDSAHYQPVRTPESLRIMKISRSGMLSVCLARQSPGTPYNVPYLVKRTGESLEVSALRFKKTVSTFLGDCSTIRQKIEDQSLGRADLDKIVDEYNKCIDQQSTVAFTVVGDPKLAALNDFKKELEKDSSVPPDAHEILKDLYIKVKDGKPVPNYLAEGLREALKDFPAYREQFETLLNTLKK